MFVSYGTSELPEITFRGGFNVYTSDPTSPKDVLFHSKCFGRLYRITSQNPLKMMSSMKLIHKDKMQFENDNYDLDAPKA